MFFCSLNLFLYVDKSGLVHRISLTHIFSKCVTASQQQSCEETLPSVGFMIRSRFAVGNFHVFICLVFF